MSSLYLPQAPTEQEKYLYTKRNAYWFSIYGLFAFFCTCIAVYFWIGINSLHLIYLIYFIVYGIFLTHTYTIGLLSKDFDISKHKWIVNKFAKVSSQKSIDIYLPVCGEDLEVIENSMYHISRLQWNGKITKYVLDDKGVPEVEQFCAKYGFQYISRPDKGWFKKAGNLRYAFERTKGDFITIFDADFCPRTDFLTELMPYFENEPTTAIVQSPQFFHTYNEQNQVQKGFIYKQELFYRLIQPSRDIFGGSVCVGTNAIYRREALEPFGGTALIGHSEDMHTGYNVVSAGWKIKYVSLILAKGLAPETLSTYFTQQYRWALGNMVLIFSKRFWMAKVPAKLKINYVGSIFYYLSFAFGIFCNFIPAFTMMYIYPNLIQWTHFLLATPLFLLGFLIQPLWSISPWSFGCFGVSESARYASWFAFWDMLRGRELGWVSTGDKLKANKLKSYIVFRYSILICSTIVFVALFGGSIYHILTKDVEKANFVFYPFLFFACVYYAVSLSILRPETSEQLEPKTLTSWTKVRRFNFINSGPVLSGFILMLLVLGFSINSTAQNKELEAVANFQNTEIQQKLTQLNNANNIAQNSTSISTTNVATATNILKNKVSSELITPKQTNPEQGTLGVKKGEDNSAELAKVTKLEENYTITAVEGDSLTTLAREAVDQYGINQKTNFTDNQKLFIENEMAQKRFREGMEVYVDTRVNFSKLEIKSYLENSKTIFAGLGIE